MGSIHGVEGCSFGRIAGAACPEARPVDDIDDADDADEPRTKARRRRVRLKRRSPRGAPKAKGVPCDFRRGFVDVVDFVGIVEGHLRGGPPPERGRETWGIGNWNWRLATLAHWQHSTHVANVKRLPVPMLPVFNWPLGLAVDNILALATFANSSCERRETWLCWSMSSV